MSEVTGKSFEESSSDIKDMIITLVGKEELINVLITDKKGKEYKVIKGVLTPKGIEVNKDMVSKELDHDIIIEYNDIKKIEDKVKQTVIFEDITK
jgi:hypothetical protein